MNINQLQLHASQIVVLFKLITCSPIVASSFCIWKCYFQDITKNKPQHDATIV